MTPEQDAKAQVTGTVARVVYANTDTYWTVLVLAPETGDTPVTVVGAMAGVRENERLEVNGHWERDRRHGWQLRIERYRIALPVTREGIARYLASGLIPGIGPKTAELLVGRFGEQTLEIIRGSPERLRQVKGVGQKKINEIAKAFREHAGFAELLAYLHGIGVSLNLARRIHAQYGDDAVGKLRQNPWALAGELIGVGFKRADAIAQGMGLLGDHPERLSAGILHTLDEARRDGHVALPREELSALATTVLGVSAEDVERGIDAALAGGRAVADRGLIYPKDLHRAELRIVKNLAGLLAYGPPPFPEGLLDMQLGRAELELGIVLADAQREAVRCSLGSTASVITGGPGTGKTTIIRTLVSALKALGLKVALAAPTGRAAKRLAAATHEDARTVHRLLEWQPAGGFARDEAMPLEVDVVVVDEVSMVDLALFDALLRAMRRGARLTLVGDADQLPSVGPGSVLRDIIESKAIPVVSLRHIFRQDQGSWITVNAHRVLAGELPVPAPEGDKADFYWIIREDTEGVVDVLPRVLGTRIPEAFGLNPITDVQVLTPVHRGRLGAEALNEQLGALLNPGRGEGRFARGDKVMQVRNNYDKEVFNGDVGFVVQVGEGGDVHVAFEDSGRFVNYARNETDDLIPAWAITIHKSQGSEYPAVVLILHSSHYMMLRRKLVVVIGSRKAMERAVSASTEAPRYGGLADRLSELLGTDR